MKRDVIRVLAFCHVNVRSALEGLQEGHARIMAGQVVGGHKSVRGCEVSHCTSPSYKEFEGQSTCKVGTKKGECASSRHKKEDI